MGTQTSSICYSRVCVCVLQTHAGQQRPMGRGRAREATGTRGRRRQKPRRKGSKTEPANNKSTQKKAHARGEGPPKHTQSNPRLQNTSTPPTAKVTAGSTQVPEESPRAEPGGQRGGEGNTTEPGHPHEYAENAGEREGGRTSNTRVRPEGRERNQEHPETQQARRGRAD